MHFRKNNWQEGYEEGNEEGHQERHQERHEKALLCLVLLVKAVVLVGVFALLHPGLQTDAVEILYWARELQWSGQKHPAMPAWILKVFFLLLPNTVASYYLVGQITLLATYFFVWRLAKEMLAPLPALLATLILACGLFYSFYSLTYNANTVSVASWAAFNFFFWKALDERRFRWWMALAVTATIALLTKYAAVLLFLAAGTTLLMRPHWRACLKTYKPYAAIATVAALSMPHWLWVLENDYATFAYVTAQITQEYTAPFFPALYFPLRFTYGQVVNMLPVFVCFAVFVLSRQQRLQPPTEESRSSTDKKIFLLTMGLLPFGVSIAFSAILQEYLHSLWGLFYWNLAGISLFYFCRRQVTESMVARRLPVFFAVWASLVLLTTAGFLSLPFVASPQKAWLFDGPYQVYTKAGVPQQTLEIPPSLRPYFDSKFLASRVSEGWREEHGSPLSIVGGEWWLAVNVSFFASSKPDLVTLFEGTRTAWVEHHRDRWREKGGVLLWFARSSDEGLPTRYQKILRDRSYVLQKPFVLPWQNVLGMEVKRVRGVPAPRIGWAVVSPQPEEEKGE